MEKDEDKIPAALSKRKSRYQLKKEKSKHCAIFSEISSKITKEIFQCDFCPSYFANENQLKYHAKSHLGIKEYKCDECQCVFSGANKLERHKQKVHCETLLCKFCQANFNHINSLKLHLRLHTGEKPYVCNECGSKFVQSSHLSIHKRSHTGEKPYQCYICKQTFKQISHLRTHERIHTQTKPYSCEFCGNSFIQKSSLKRHIRIHTDERPYKCQECNAAFRVKNNLTRHMVVHTGDHPYSCDLCDSSFSQPIDLKRHKVSHTGIKPFMCDQCKASFSRKNNLKWHKMIHTGETPFKCDLCENQYCKPRDLKKHLLTHDPLFKASMCQICGQEFPQAVALKRHMKTHNGNEYHCKECSACFADKSSLKRHMYKHKCISNFQCTDCNCEFKDEEALKCHMELHNLKASKITPAITNVDEKSECLQIEASNVSEENMDKKLAVPFSLAQDYIQQCTPDLVNNHDLQLNSLNYPAYINLSSLQALPQQAPVQTIIMPSGSNPPIRLARLAANCGNHNLHIHILGHNNQVQSWCFCENLNLPQEDTQPNTCCSDSISDTCTVACEEPNYLQAQNHIENQSSLVRNEPKDQQDSVQMFNVNPQISNPVQSSHHAVIEPQIPADTNPTVNDNFKIVSSGQYLTNQFSTLGLWLNNVIEA